MNFAQTLPRPLTDLLQSQQDEITLYKWIASEKAGHDIGWNQATQEWFDRHFPEWVKGQKRLIDEALAAADYDSHSDANHGAVVSVTVQ